MSRLDRDAILARLTAEDVADDLGICARGDQRWRARWMRARSCARLHHNSECFALARDGMWKCHSCDEGGDLLSLIAAALGVDVRTAFPDVLARAAEIAGVEGELDNPFEQATPRAPRPVRPAPPPLPPLETRMAVAAHRAAWAWPRLYGPDELRMIGTYLAARGLDPAAVLAREELRATPLRITAGLRTAIETRHPDVSDDLRTLWWTMGCRRGTLSIVAPVRGVETGAILDLRARRLQPEDCQPKILGMVGGVTADAAQPGKPRRLVACYGHPHAIELAHVVVVEGLFDYLTALQVWPHAQAIGAVEAGSLSLVAGWAARALAARGDACQLTIVEQNDPARVHATTGATIPGAADAAINDDPNAATKVAIRYLGAARVGWLACAALDPVTDRPALVDGKPVKDLNDLYRAQLAIYGDPERAAAAVRRLVVAWADLAITARAG